MKKLLFLVFIIMIGIAGCGTTSMEDTSVSSTEQKSSSEVESNSSNNPTETTEEVNIPDRSTNSTAEETTKVEESVAIEARGTFEGEADSHTIEVIAETPLAIQYSEEISGQISQLSVGDKVLVKYEDNSEGQLLLLEIEKIE